MDKNDLLKIAFGALIAVVFKDFFSWLVSKSKPFAALAARVFGKWILRHAFAIEFAADVGLLVSFSELFYLFPYNETVVTYAGVKVQIMLGLLIGIQIRTVMDSFKRWLAYKKALDF
jgi:hypothetical protein